ncbi:Hypothetical protein TGAM_2008 [Thermococcus gammatolerans EJ3]|uniref:Uncharacterized protein n=2 Tax=Thermococcus TaxID=2263 RepID=C5A291_THEGJ|nr:Hypothetical protein TGAM_2008 [Thermococcus gammatolerans EJ3]
MMGMRWLLVFLLLLLIVPLAVAQDVKIVEYKIDGTMKMVVDEAGNARVEEAWKFTPNLYLQMKQSYPTTYMLKREFENKRTDAQYEGMKIEWDDTNNRITSTYTMLGAAINGGSHWEIRIGDKDTTLSAQNGNTLVLTTVEPILGGQGRLVETITLVLPKGAKNIKFEDGIVKYELPSGSERNPVYLGLVALSLVGLAILNFPKRG